MIILTLARKAIKVIYFILISWVTARTLGSPELWVSHDLTYHLCHFIYGSVNIETIYDTLFYIDLSSVIFITSIIYYLTIKLFRRIKGE